MNDIQASDTAPRPKRFRNALLLAGVAFAAGIGLTAWAVTSWKPAHDLVAQPAASPSDGDAAPPAALPPAPQSLSGTTVMPPVATVPPQQSVTDSRIAALEARLSTLAQASAGPLGNSRRAEGLLLAFAARRALDRGLTLGYLEPELQSYFGETQPRAVASVLAASRAPATQAMLAAELDRIAPTLSNPAREDGILATIRREIAGLFVVRQAGSAPTAAPDRVAHARELLKIGRVDQAMAEISRVDRDAKATVWLGMARRHVEANNALDLLEAAALTSPRPGNAIVPPAPAPAPAPQAPAEEKPSAPSGVNSGPDAA